MALIHDVIDSDVRFVINPVTRTISNQGSGKLILIQGDHNSERFTFEIPKKVEGHDMSLCNVVRIHYINTNSKTRETSEDIYEPKDMRVSEDDPNLVVFSWLISGNATVHPGGLAFAIEFQCTIGQKVEYAWHTAANSTISISDGIHNSEAVIENYSDILTEWWLRIYANSTLPIEIHSMESFAALNGETKENTLYLLEDDPTLDELLEHVKNQHDYGKDITELKSTLSTLTTQLTGVAAGVERITSAFTTMQNEVRLLSDRILELENDAGNKTPDDPNVPDTPDNPGTTHTHAYTKVARIVEPSCDTQGYTEYVCECGEGGSVKKDFVTAFGHQYESSVTHATCSEPGYTTHTCSVCGDSYKDTYTDPTGHSWNYYEDADSGDTGWSRRCTECGFVEYNVEDPCIDGGEHIWVEEDMIAATCDEPAYQTYRCSVCDKTKKEAVSAPLGHSYGETTVIEATCTERGYTSRTCENCGHVDKKITAQALGHDLRQVVAVLPSTCTFLGYDVWDCNRCDEQVTVKHTKYAEHDWEVYPDPTASSGQSRRCRVCELVEEDI